MMKILLLAVLLATCECQSTAKHSDKQAGSRCFIDEAIQEEVQILKKQVETLEAMQKMYKSQQGKFLKF